MEGHTHHHYLPTWLQVVLIVFASIFGLLALGFVLAPTLLKFSLSHYMDAPVKVGGIGFHWKEFTIYDLEISNPKEFDLPHAAEVHSVKFKAPLTNYLYPCIDIDKIEIDDLYISLIFTNEENTEGNWTTLMHSLVEKPRKRAKLHQRSIMIKEIELANTRVDLKLKGKKLRKLPPIKHIALHDIGTKTGIPEAQITKIIVRQVFKSLSTIEGIANMVGGVVSAPIKVLEGIISPFTFLFGHKKSSDSETEPEESPKQPAPEQSNQK